MRTAVDRGLGLGAIGCALLSVLEGHAASLPGATVVGLFAVVGLSFLRREPVAARTGGVSLLPCLASVASSALVLRQAPPPADWSLAAALAFAAAGAVAMASLLVLGRSFAILPARRVLVARGPYRWLRHPAYAGELGMMGASAWAAWSLGAIAAVTIATALLIVRVLLEERAFAGVPAYRAYTACVRWRLLPGVW